MRPLPSLSLVLVAAGWILACGGGVEDGTPSSDGTPAGVGRASDAPGAATGTGTGTDLPAKTPTTNPLGDGCATPGESVLVSSGGVIARPAGSVLRLDLLYRGSAIGVRALRGVDMIIGASSGPYVAGEVAGYWVETRGGSGTLYQHWLPDPTRLEAPGGPNGEPFQNLTIDRCEPKLIGADVPNDASATELLVFGSPYGTQDAAIELARFTLK